MLNVVSPLSGIHSAVAHPTAPYRMEGIGRDSFLQEVVQLAQLGQKAHARSDRRLLTQFRENAKEISRVCAKLSGLSGAGLPVPVASEWLLDNKYVIDAVVQEVKVDLPTGYYRELPALSAGPFQALPRVYELAVFTLIHADSSLTDHLLREVVDAYQTETPLTIGELWAFPTMLRLGLLENLRRLAVQVLTLADEHQTVRGVFDSILEGKKPALPTAPSPCYVLGVAERLREVDLPPGEPRTMLLGWCQAHLNDVSKLQHAEFCAQAADQVSIGNAITSLRLLNVIDWTEFFENHSAVEKVLRQDAIYPRQDFATRDRCRKTVEMIAKGTGKSEVFVSQLAMEQTRSLDGDPVKGQVSYALLGPGQKQLQSRLSFLPKWHERKRDWIEGHPYAIYFGLLLVFIAIGLAAFQYYTHAMPLWAYITSGLCVAVLLSEVSLGQVHRIVSRAIPPRRLPRFAFKEGIPSECATFVVIPAILGKSQQAAELLQRLEQHYFTSNDDNLWFALLTDYTDATEKDTPLDTEIITALLSGVEKLNQRHASEGSPRFFVFHRSRQWNASEGCWMGWERKRGKLIEFNDLLRGVTTTSYSVRSSEIVSLPHIRYVLTLDADTVLPRDTARVMIATMYHPLNRPVLSGDGRRVVQGYSVMQPRVSFLYRTGFRSLFARWFACSAGIDPYSAAVSDTYMDLFAKGTFTGKGLYDVDAFHETTKNAFPENQILSHDLIESNFARCALMTEAEVFDGFPTSYMSYAKRDHRWVRGDWQLLPWLMRRVPTNKGRQNNVLPMLEQWKIFDNLRRSMLPVFTLLYFALVWTVFPNPVWLWTLLGLLPICFPLLTVLLQSIDKVMTRYHRFSSVRHPRGELVCTAGQAALQITFLPHQAWMAIDAIGRTLYRLLVSRRKMLEWETAANVEKKQSSGVRQAFRSMWIASAISVGLFNLVVFTAPESLWVASPLLLLWLVSPGITHLVSRPQVVKRKAIPTDVEKELVTSLKKIWKFFDTFVREEDNWLPPDNYQEDPLGVVAHRTSPTNIGVYLLAVLSVHRFGLITLQQVTERLSKAFNSLDKLQRHQGHWLNWYDTSNLSTLHPAYVSTVDSGNFLACLIALKNGLLETATAETIDAALKNDLVQLAARAERMASEMDFRFLYSKDRSLFSIGYNVDIARLDSNYYDLLASEACITSFIAIATGQVERKHWFQLGRLVTRCGSESGLVSWGGTMFEYLMPRIFFSILPGVLLDQAHRTAVCRQMEYGQEIGLPWGISESAFYIFDKTQQYQYQSFGVPGLGLKRGLRQDKVIAPYATFLSVDIEPKKAVSNLRKIKADGGEGEYGFYEALDYTTERIGEGKRCSVVKAYMAHHQGMSLLAIVNLLEAGLIRKWLHAEPVIRSAELLLEERIPGETPLVEPDSPEMSGEVMAAPVLPSRRRIATADTPVPRTHLLSNGRYAVMVTNSGSGFSRCGDIDVTRWRADATMDQHGQFVYIRNRRDGRYWSTAHQPTGVYADEYEVIFSLDKAEFHRVDGELDSLTEVTVVPDADVEIRRVTLTNLGKKSLYLDVTSYAEVVLSTLAADMAHPAFGKLFLETEWLPQYSALLCHRRPRSPGEPSYWAVHVLADTGNMTQAVSYETDRAQFLGRRRTPHHPAALDLACHRLGCHAGAVLDPIFALRKSIKVKAGEKETIGFATGMADSREGAIALADRYHSISAIHRGFELAWAHTQIETRHAHLRPDDVHLFQRLAGQLLYPMGPLRAADEVLAQNQLGQNSLWSYGISGDLPIMLLRLHGAGVQTHLKQLLKAHQFWQSKGLKVDFVVLCENSGGYYDAAHAESEEAVRAAGMEQLLNQNGGIFIRKGGQMSEADRVLLLSVARIVIDDRSGPLHTQGKSMWMPKTGGPASKGKASFKLQSEPITVQMEKHSRNGFGGFTEDGREYIIQPNVGDRLPPTPWSNVIANPKVGFVVTDSGGGYSWIGNSQLNRLTPWSNDPVADEPGEVIYLQEKGSGAFWSTTPLPASRQASIIVSHGQGYTSFQGKINGIEHDHTVTLPEADPVKLTILRLKNSGTKPVTLAVTYYCEWVLGTHRHNTAQHVVTFTDGKLPSVVLAKNAFHPDHPRGVSFVACSLKGASFTGNRMEFVGRNRTLASPLAMDGQELSGQVGPGLDPCAALQGEVNLAVGEEKTIIFLLGQGANLEEVAKLVARYQQPQQAEEAEQEMVSWWDETCDTIQVKTPDASFDALMNRWLVYQTLSCRMWGRSSFYQSGGAFGFRDQLQDSMALVYSVPDITRKHILYAATRQFAEGDVQHWWHPDSGAGVRTRFSDDFLFLPFVVSHYTQVTGDDSILEESVSFLAGEPLQEHQHERYTSAAASTQSATLYEHCVRALDYGWKLGSHGLPLMGIGDWNDGMNRVGIEGKGESIWLAWFQIVCLTHFIEIARKRQDNAMVEKCRSRIAQLREAVESHGYDGQWYRRAYFDDGTPLGSASNEECQIDSIVQSWAVMANGNLDRASHAMDHVMRRLVRRKDHMVLLFDPAFDQGRLQPGYIKGYLPGIRENGGQYTHAACWVVQALAGLGRNEEAMEVFQLLNPVRASDSLVSAMKYRGEPYVIAADVYNHPQHVGRAGWTWYTGSASWYYRMGLEVLLGFQLRGNTLRINPCIPACWPKFEIVFRYGKKTVYKIEVINAGAGEGQLSLDGKALANETIPLVDDGVTHSVVVKKRYQAESRSA